MTEYYDDDFDFNADMSAVDETANDFTPIPADDYLLQLVQAELKDTAGGKMVSARFEVIEGDYKGRNIFENFNLQHKSHQTVEIALRQVKQWVKACRINPNQRLTMKLIHELEGIEFIGTVYIQKDKTGQYGPQNRIRKYQESPFAMNKKPEVPQQRASGSDVQPPPQPQAASNSDKRPWER